MLENQNTDTQEIEFQKRSAVNVLLFFLYFTFTFIAPLIILYKFFIPQFQYIFTHTRYLSKEDDWMSLFYSLFTLFVFFFTYYSYKIFPKKNSSAFFVILFECFMILLFFLTTGLSSFYESFFYSMLVNFFGAMLAIPLRTWKFDGAMFRRKEIYESQTKPFLIQYWKEKYQQKFFRNMKNLVFMTFAFMPLLYATGKVLFDLPQKEGWTGTQNLWYVIYIAGSIIFTVRSFLKVEQFSLFRKYNERYNKY